MSRRRVASPLPLLLPFAIAALAAGAAAQDVPDRSQTFSGTAQVTAVELVVDVRDEDGRAPANLSPADFEIREDGELVTVIGVEPFRATVEGESQPPAAAPTAPRVGRGEQGAWDWRLAIWFDQELSSTRSIRRAAETLAAQAGALTALGTVEIIVAGGSPHVALPRTRSAALVEQTLLQLARDTAGRDQLRRIRRQYLEALQLQGEMEGRNMPRTVRQGPGQGGGAGGGPGGGGGGEDGPEGGGGLQAQSEFSAAFRREFVILENVAAERMVIGRRLDLLFNFLALHAEPAPKALLLVNDGWDLDPRDFYLVGMPMSTQLEMDLTAQLASVKEGSALDGLGRFLSTTGWTSISVASGALEAGSTMSAELSGHGRLGEIVGGSADAVSAIPSALVAHPNAPLVSLADATGGEALLGLKGLPSALGRLADRVRLTYQVERPPDATQRKVEVRSLRAGLEVKAPTWAGVPAGDAVSAARARGLLAGDPVDGELDLEAAVGSFGPSPVDEEDRLRGELQARLDLTPIRAALASSSASDVRVTIAVAVPEAAPFVHQSVVPKQRLSRLTSWTYALPLELPSNFDRVVVVLEESHTGAWGASLAARVEGRLPDRKRAPSPAVAGDDPVAAAETDPDAILDLLPARKPILLVPPESEPAIGKHAFEPLVAAEAVASVEYHLDGKKVATRGERPFAAQIDLGELPLAHELVAVARDAAGAELGRDTLEINAGTGAFSIRLIEPRSSTGVGTVDVEAEVAVPGAGFKELDRVEIFWNGERAATLFAPPFRQRVRIPPEAPHGFLTAVAFRKDGSSVEDVRLMNDEGESDSVDVRLVELATSVTDGSGRPVTGLGREAFRVFEAGVPQTLDAVRDSRELPLTLGVALDSSASMFEEMSTLQRAAIDFVSLTLDRADRAFVVDFDSEPRLAVELTGDLGTLSEGIAQLRPGGGTALCDALTFSLARLQRVRGRRALVVLSDGLGRDERVSWAACQRFVARSGVPVYLLILPETGPSDPERTAAAAERAAQLVAPSGGRVLRVAGLDRLGAVYAEVQRELRAQYVLSYYPIEGAETASVAGDWREVRVQVVEPGLAARTARGYYR